MKKINQDFTCTFPCGDVIHTWIVPEIQIEPETVKIVLISEAPPNNKEDYYYGSSTGSFQNTTRIAFQDAGYPVKNIKELIDKGIYFTTAIKCCKKEYIVSSKTLKNCSKILFQELAQFPNKKVIMCMGDFAIKCINYIMKKDKGHTIIPSGPTYKIRTGKFIEDSILYIPSYTQTGDSFHIEKSKRRMIAEDIKKAMQYAKI